jgi:hypothetical protein
MDREIIHGALLLAANLAGLILVLWLLVMV